MKLQTLVKINKKIKLQFIIKLKNYLIIIKTKNISKALILFLSTSFLSSYKINESLQRIEEAVLAFKVFSLLVLGFFFFLFPLMKKKIKLFTLKEEQEI